MVEIAKNILIIEDDEGIAHLAKKYLEKSGFQASIALKGSDALELINTNKYDLLILDFALPDMMADELLEQLERAGIDIPFIITTGRGCSTIARELIAEGARDFIVKNDNFWTVLPSSVSQVLCNAENTAGYPSEKDKKKQIQINRLKNFSDKMLSLNRLAFTVGHDLNNILSGIIGYSELVELSIENNSQALKYNKLIYESSKRAEELSNNLLFFSRIKNSEFSEIRINYILQEILNNVYFTYGKDNIKLELTAESDCVYAGKPLIFEVIRELLINAEESLDKAKEIILTTTEVSLESDFLPAILRNEIIGKFIRISVRDSGCGIKPGDYRSVFEPYFTTKTIRGTGLGLTNVYNFIKYHKGAIDLISTPGKGSCFYIYLPLK